MPVSPLVAIVGRPNVGKSTLFNRIIRRRQAVVDERSGVTRDRIYSHAEWGGVRFRLVDTGGLVPHSKDPMEVAIRAQVRVAIDEASLVLFVADVETGVTDLDSSVASELCRSGRPVVLAVNKVDNEQREVDIHFFHALGLGTPWPLSAISGRGSGDLLDAVIKTLYEAVPEEVRAGAAGFREEEKGPPKIAVLGRPNVGKSSYVNAICGTERVIVSPTAGTTRDSSDIEVEINGEPLVLIDTAGLRRKSRVRENIEYYSALRALQSLDRCDVALLLIDAEDNVTHQDARILVRILRRGKGAVLVVNKWDLVEKETGTAESYELEIRDRLPFARYIPLVFISSKTGQRVARALDHALQAGRTRRHRIQTARFNAFMESTLKGNEAITPAMGDMRISYAVQAGVEPPTFLFFVNDPKKVKPNFKRYLERRIRQEFNLTGTPIRLSFRSKT
ncbi:MAG: ribosome biogenesis GTPase Der [Candidatus Latescibacteria bacterium]|nr:ribosome biogenesis GTPase Der [Candidatus Latescibacterota bacterium]